MPTSKFAITGVAGFVAPRHLHAITSPAINGTLCAALDPHDSVGIIDRYAPKALFFTEPERFERHLQRNRVDWLAVCSPNYLHEHHVRMGLLAGADVICEKPLALTPWNLDMMERTETATGRRVYTVLQLRQIPKLIGLRYEIMREPRLRKVQLEYRTPRGQWYHRSWKGDTEKSGGLVTNIGIHLLDLVMWLFGPVDTIENQRMDTDIAEGRLQLAGAEVDWLLSIQPTPDGKPVRRLRIDYGPWIEFEGFGDMHAKVYEETLAGRGAGIETARPAVELAYRLRSAK